MAFVFAYAKSRFSHYSTRCFPLYAILDILPRTCPCFANSELVKVYNLKILFAYLKFKTYFILSYDVVVNRLIMSCHKYCYYHTCINTFGGDK